MITVTFVKNEDRKITGLFMDGHAGYAEAGSDIVCAGASTLLYTAANALETICGYLDSDTTNIHEGEDGSVYAEIVLPPDGIAARADAAQMIMRTVEVGFITLASSVNKDGNRYVKITEKI